MLGNNLLCYSEISLQIELWLNQGTQIELWLNQGTQIELWLNQGTQKWTHIHFQSQQNEEDSEALVDSSPFWV